jgi:hypothetical protein
VTGPCDNFLYGFKGELMPAVAGRQMRPKWESRPGAPTTWTTSGGLSHTVTVAADK